MALLRELASRAGAKDAFLKKVSKLAAGRHPASSFLKRARNNLGFHWDSDVIQRSVVEFGRNRQLVWLEFNEQSTEGQVYRLANDVLAHALFPELAHITDVRKTQEPVRVALTEMSEAMDIVIEFFIAATYGYMKEYGVDRRERAVRRRRAAAKPLRKRKRKR
jgi:hypothetical protein